MNRIFRTLWSATRQCWQAVPENTKSASKGSSKTASGASSTGGVASVILGFMFTGSVGAQSPPSVKTLPTGGVVAQGAVTISQTATAQAAAMTVNQSSQRAVINWNTFNLGSAASVNFAQPNAQAVTLNRVSDANPSQIYGRITAPGQVFLSNPNGVYFSPTSQVDVGALTATTHSISDANFMAGNYRFERNGATGKVVNEGNISAALGGYVALLAPEVQNAGVVVAQAGTVAMAAGELISLNFNGVGGLASLTTTPSTIASLVENKHAVLAPDGQIVLSAVALNKLQAGVVKNIGSLEANSLVNKGGKIVLEGDDITLNRNSKIEAKGPNGGGTVLVGGDWQGSGEMRQATKVTMAAGASIDASATDKGDGGKVVLWSDVHNANSVTAVHGSIKAQAGSNGGDGGKVETSGHQLNVDGIQVQTNAPAGEGGTWLLDPYDVTIPSSATATDTLAAGVYTPSANTSNILDTDLQTALANGNVEVTTTGAGAQTGNITISSALSWASANSLTLTAAGGVNGSSNIGMTGGGSLIFNQAGDSTYSGTISGTGSVTKQGAGALTLSGPNTYSGGSTLSAGTLKAGSVTPLGSGAVTVASGASLDLNGKALTSTGGLTLNGTGIAVLGVNQGALFNSSVTDSSYAGLVTLGDDALIRTADNGGLMLFNTGTITGAHVLSFAGNAAITVRSVLGTDLTGLIFGMSGFKWTNLNAVNTYNGPITINANSSMRFYGGLLGGGNYSGNIVNNGRIYYESAGTQTLSGVISGTGAGGFRIYNGTLILAGANTFGGAIDVINIGGSPTLVVGGAGTLNSTVNISATNSGSVVRYASTANQTLSGVLSGTGSFIKDTGTMSTLTLSGTNTFTGTLAVNSGTLRAASDAALGGTAGSTTVGSAGTLELGGAANLAIGAEPLIVADGGTVHNVAGANTYAGPLTLSGNATVTIDTGTSLNFSAAGAGITVNSGKVLTLNTDGNVSFTQALIGSGSYSKTGSGTLTSGAGSTLAVYSSAPPAPPPDPALTNPEIVAMTPAQVASISGAQINMLTQAQMALFTPIQLMGLANWQIRMFTQTQVAGLTASQMQAFTATQLSALSPFMMAGLTNAQLGGLNAQQVQSLSIAQLDALSAAQIGAMNSANAVVFSAAQMGNLTQAQLVGFSTQQVQSLTGVQLAALSSAQIATLNPNHQLVFTGAQLGALSLSQFAGFSVSQVAALSMQQLSGLTSAQVGSLSSAHLGSLNTQQVQSLTGAQLTALSAAQIATLNAGHQVVFTAAQLGALSTGQLAGLSASQVGALSVQQLSGLTPKQLRGLNQEQLASLSYKQLVSLTVAQLSAFKPEQLMALMPPATAPVPVATPPVAVAAVLSEPAPVLNTAPTQRTNGVDAITIPAPGITVQPSTAQSTGVLAVTLLDNVGVNRSTAVGVAFEQDVNTITLKSLDTPLITSAPRIDLPTTNAQLISFTLTLDGGELVEFQGGLVGSRLMIVAPTSNARQAVRTEMKRVLAAAITSLGKVQRLLLADLQGVVFDLR